MPNKKHKPTTPEMWEAAKKYGKVHGYYGVIGGWIYDKNNKQCCHGWSEFVWYIGWHKIKNFMERRLIPYNFQFQVREGWKHKRLDCSGHYEKVVTANLPKNEPYVAAMRLETYLRCSECGYSPLPDDFY